jgi:thiol-disulfide isomerase/thioredoxin
VRDDGRSRRRSCRLRFPSEAGIDVSAYTVFVLCAEWCGVCREFRAAVDDAAAKPGSHRYVWIDIEDEADRLGEIEVETFPTLAVLRGGMPVFFGPTLPSMQAVDKLLRAELSPGALGEEHREWLATLAAEFPADAP